MTLACEDGHQIEAHKVVLVDVANKIFFLNAYNFGTVSPTEVPRTLK